ncbi:sensor domain-containing diguanylate cyclase [Chitinibacter fontanus]|uniref:sensor domain-containing diguanylate cyclase n=1 Tax=Chitinibacter fontanus TaxID=1737446 RepID=UPI001D13AAB7|nr:sensor domain-containing diguanylate cyclase [Chitinibacter fontanus]
MSEANLSKFGVGVKVFSERLHLLILVASLLVLGFLTTSLASYWVSRDEIHHGIVKNALPMTGDNIYSEIQKDMLRPVFISSQMAHDTFVRDWMLKGEQDTSQIVRYLTEVKEKNGTFTSFLVSDKTHRYYHPGGVLKEVRESDVRDAWFFRVRAMKTPFETNVDADMAHRDRMTIFINHQVLDFQGQFIGAIGVGVTLDTMAQLLKSYEQRFGRRIYFVNPRGEVVLTAQKTQLRGSIRDHLGLNQVAAQIINQDTKPTQLSYQLNGQEIQLNSRFIPELGWYLIVEQNETEILRPVQRILLINLAISALITLLVLAVALYSINRTQCQLEQLASTDALTQLPNRQAFEVVLQQKLNELARRPRAISGVFMDIDWFKQINDQFGHAQGDAVLQEFAQLLRHQSRASDVVARWGGEEFILILDDCDLDNAVELAEKLRQTVEQHPFQLPRQTGITISVGVTQWQEQESSADFFQRLDDLLYQAKTTGRNQVVHQRKPE